MKLNLAEELLLLALKDKEGTVLLSVSSALQFGLAGAVLMDLYGQKKIELEGKRIIAPGSAGPKDATLYEYWQEIQSKDKPKPIRYWVERFGRSGKLRKKLLERLIEKGILTRESRRVLLLFSGSRYPMIDARPETEERLRIREAVLEDKPVEIRTFMLISLIQACDLIREVFPAPDRKAAKKKIKAMVKDEAFGKVVSEEIAAVIVACLIASTAAACAAST